jgi:hypothetical protein
MRLLIAALSLLVTVSCSVFREQEETVRVFGSKRPDAVGDTATLCAVSVVGGRWSLYSTVKHVRVADDGVAFQWETMNARSACKTMMWDQGVLVDTIPVVDVPWSLTSVNKEDSTRKWRSRV